MFNVILQAIPLFLTISCTSRRFPPSTFTWTSSNHINVCDQNKKKCKEDNKHADYIITNTQDIYSTVTLTQYNHFCVYQTIENTSLIETTSTLTETESVYSTTIQTLKETATVTTFTDISTCCTSTSYFNTTYSVTVPISSTNTHFISISSIPYITVFDTSTLTNITIITDTEIVESTVIHTNTTSIRICDNIKTPPDEICNRM